MFHNTKLLNPAFHTVNVFSIVEVCTSAILVMFISDNWVISNCTQCTSNLMKISRELQQVSMEAHGHSLTKFKRQEPFVSGLSSTL